MTTLDLIENTALVCFAFSSIMYLLSFNKGKLRLINFRIAFSLFTFGTITAFSSLLFMKAESYKPMSGSMLAAVLGLITILSHIKGKIKTIGSFIAPLITLILLIQMFINSSPQNNVQIASYPKAFLMTHIVFATSGEAFAIIAFGISVIYLWQRRVLKQKLLKQLSNRVPAIDNLENYLNKSLWIGFILMTLALLSGVFFFQNWGNQYSDVFIKVIWAISIWIWYLAILIARYTFQLPMRTIAKMSLIGFFLLTLTFFGVFAVNIGVG